MRRCGFTSNLAIGFLNLYFLHAAIPVAAVGWAAVREPGMGRGEPTGNQFLVGRADSYWRLTRRTISGTCGRTGTRGSGGFTSLIIPISTTTSRLGSGSTRSTRYSAAGRYCGYCASGRTPPGRCHRGIALNDDCAVRTLQHAFAAAPRSSAVARRGHARHAPGAPLESRRGHRSQSRNRLFILDWLFGRNRAYPATATAGLVIGLAELDDLKHLRLDWMLAQPSCATRSTRPKA